MKIKMLAAVLALFAITACTANKSQEAEVPAPIVLEDRSHPQIAIVYGSEAEYHVVKIMDKQMDLTGNLPRVVVRLKNTVSSKVPFEYQCIWEDEFGAPLITSSAWQRVTLPQNGEKVIVDMGKSVKAKKVTMHVRFPVDVPIWVPTPDPATMSNQPL